MNYKLIKKLPFENSPKIGYISKPRPTIKDIDHYWNHNWFNPKNYPEFWQPIVEKDYEILSLVASEKNPQHKKGSKFLHNKDYKFKNMHPTEFWDIYSVKKISDNKIFTIGDSYEDLIIEKMFMSVAGDILTTYKPKVKQPLFTTEDGVDIFEGDIVYSVSKSFALNGNIAGITVFDNCKLFLTKEKAEEYVLLNKPCLSYNEVFNAAKIRNKNTFVTLKTLIKSKIQQSV